MTIKLGCFDPGTAGCRHNPVVRQLLPYIPRANDATGNTFIGSANALVNINQWSASLSHTLSSADTLSGLYVFQTAKRNEPTIGGATVLGFGDVRYFRRQFLSLVETHVFPVASSMKAASVSTFRQPLLLPRRSALRKLPAGRRQP